MGNDMNCVSLHKTPTDAVPLRSAESPHRLKSLRAFEEAAGEAGKIPLYPSLGKRERRPMPPFAKGRKGDFPSHN